MLTENREAWYRRMAFYQIWPRSFRDGNGDGIGDLYGVLEKLDYIKSLGVDGIWFSPLYPSPNADYGYDIADYRAISPDYGDLSVFRQVLDGAHARGMKVIMDLVVNHTSDEHAWFKKSRAGEARYRDYYIWRQGKPGGKLPNDWDSLFEGKAWQYDEQAKKYYLHLFAVKQPDLNMDNPLVREEVKGVMRFWLDLGIDGFREDVITFISKARGLPDDPLMPFAKGLRFYNSGPRVHEFLQEFRRDVLDHYNCVTVGEAPMMTPKKALTFVAGEHPDLDLMFNFQHMAADCLFTEYMPRPFSLRKLKRVFSRWQYAMRGKAWHTLYLENHDHPRVISRYGSEQYRVLSGKSLACSYLFQMGTPFVYQGQEIGMTNIALSSIRDYKDVATIRQYERAAKKSGAEKALKLTHRASRESARTPMQWADQPNAGFSVAEPWFSVNPNYPEVNVESQEKDPDSLLNFYRAALKLRRETPPAIDGVYREFYPNNGQFYAYERALPHSGMLVICSLSERPARFRVPRGWRLQAMSPALANYPDAPVFGTEILLRPYEARVYVIR